LSIRRKNFVQNGLRTNSIKSHAILYKYCCVRVTRKIILNSGGQGVKKVIICSVIITIITYYLLLSSSSELSENYIKMISI